MKGDPDRHDQQRQRAAHSEQRYNSHHSLQEIVAVVNPPASTTGYTIKHTGCKKQYRDLAEAMPPIVWTARPDGYLDYYNQRWFDYTGMTFEQTRRWGWQPILHPDDAQRCLERWNEAILTGKPFEIACRFKRIDQAYRWHLVRALPVYDHQGEIALWVGTCTDIDDQKRAEAELALALTNVKAANEELAKANCMQSAFVSIVSHEFRSTLTSIQGFSALIRDEDFSIQEIKEYAADINTDAQRLSRLIGELLDLNHMKTGKLILNREQIDLNTVIMQLVGRMRPAAARHQLRTRLARNLPLISGDRDKLTQVITNLLTNAIKYSPAGGEVLVRSKIEDGQAHISIQDHGIGIPAHALELIFEPYARVTASETRYIEGTGIGLSLVRQIIGMHNGKTWAESVEGQGSTFHFTLPLSPAEGEANGR